MPLIRSKWLLTGIVIVVTVTSLVLSFRYDDKRTGAPPAASLRPPSTTVEPENQSNMIKREATDQHSSQEPTPRVTSVSNPTIADLSKLRSSREVVEFVRKTDDATLQEYAIRSTALVCKGYKASVLIRKQFAAFGSSKLERTQRVLKQLMEESVTGTVLLRERCADYEGSDDLQRQLGEEAERNQLPLAKTSTSIGELSRGQIPADIALGQARANLAQVLTGSQPAAKIFSLATSLGSIEPGRQGKFAQYFPSSPIEDWSLGPVFAAYQIAACRTNSLGCGTGTMERDMVCARYGECQALDVESSYRRLFELYGIPFTDTDRLANKFQQAITSGDAATLLP